MSCPSFSAYCEDPIRFLMESFDGLTETVARFLSENVFCSISDDDDESQKRVSAGEFSRWACGLVDHMGLTGPGRGRMSRGASIYHTIPLIHSRTGSMSTLPSLLSSPRPRARSLARDTDHIPDLDVTADATFRAALALLGRAACLRIRPSSRQMCFLLRHSRLYRKRRSGIHSNPSMVDLQILQRPRRPSWSGRSPKT